MAQIAQLPSIRVDLTGELRRADLDLGNFSVRLADGRQVTGLIQGKWEPLILEALQHHDSRQLRIVGFCTNDNAQEIDLTGIESMEVAGFPEDAKRFAGKSFGEIVAELTADVPDPEWDKIPVDLAENHKRYRRAVAEPR